MNENRRHHDTAAPDHEALASLLRDTDPAAGATGLDAIERARMRQAITAAADEHAVAGLWAGLRAGGWRAEKQPALAAAALITVVGLAVWTLDRTPEIPSSQVADSGVTAPGSAPASTPTTPNPAPETVPGPDAPPQLITALDPATDNATATAANEPPPPDRQARTVQFTAPRGTRIIWTLDPNFESLIAGQQPRQEQEQ